VNGRAPGRAAQVALAMAALALSGCVDRLAGLMYCCSAQPAMIVDTYRWADRYLIEVDFPHDASRPAFGITIRALGEASPDAGVMLEDPADGRTWSFEQMASGQTSSLSSWATSSGRDAQGAWVRLVDDPQEVVSVPAMVRLVLRSTAPDDTQRTYGIPVKASRETWEHVLGKPNQRREQYVGF
jgi:hypothetical protein